jgi:hypothetical protein
LALDDIEFREFFASQYARLCWLGCALTGSPAQAEELAQEALVRTWWPRVLLVTGSTNASAGEAREQVLQAMHQILAGVQPITSALRPPPTPTLSPRTKGTARQGRQPTNRMGGLDRADGPPHYRRRVQAPRPARLRHSLPLAGEASPGPGMALGSHTPPIRAVGRHLHPDRLPTMDAQLKPPARIRDRPQRRRHRSVPSSAGRERQSTGRSLRRSSISRSCSIVSGFRQSPTRS